MTVGAVGSLHVARRLWCAIPAAMPAGCVGHNSRVLTYSHCLHHLRLSTCRAFTSHRPRTALHARRMSPQAPAASATKEDGAKFPSTAGQGSQPRRASEQDKKALVEKVDAFIFDCDGVIWRGDSLIDGVPETLDLLRSLGKKLVFVTNNSTKSRAGYLSKFKKLGLNVTAEEIYSSSYAAAAYLESIDFPKDKKVYLMGDVGIEEELDLKGIKYLGGPCDADHKVELKAGYAMPHDPDVGAVVVGFDKNINYYKIQYACLCIRENPGCLFIATNLDAVTHLTDAQEWAGNGAMVGAIKGCTKKDPIVVGKPAEFMLANIADAFGMERKQICMVGDRLDTDILFGQDGGLSTMLVLSGVTTEKELLSPDNKVHPDYYTDSLPDLLSVKQSVSA
ncbi:TPA: Phosphoglycolate phosphatase 1A, chloroplastic [Trebouxia sp. C0005]